jgi:hypothetical protein
VFTLALRQFIDRWQQCQAVWQIGVKIERFRYKPHSVEDNLCKIFCTFLSFAFQLIEKVA